MTTRGEMIKQMMENRVLDVGIGSAMHQDVIADSTIPARSRHAPWGRKVSIIIVIYPKRGYHQCCPKTKSKNAFSFFPQENSSFKNIPVYDPFQSFPKI